MQCIVGISAEPDGRQLAASLEPASTSIPLENCVWKRGEPSTVIFIIYAFVVPVLSSFGLCANVINAIVFMRPKMTPSAFTYLAALSWLECMSCLLITLTALSRSIFYTSTFWLTYDFQWQTPLFGITTGAANGILGSVSCDRLVYLWSGIPKANGPPRFCRRKVARRVIGTVILVSVIVNFPYFFVFVVNKDGKFYITKFYYSSYYKIHNWFTFILLTVLPAVFLLIGNAAIIVAFRRWTRQSRVCRKHCQQGNAKNTKKRYKHQMKLTITILIVITLYMVGELPAHLTSRKSALNLLFGGDVSKVNFKLMEHLEAICITLNALQLSLNIIVYAVINPSFMPEFFSCLRGASDVCFRLFCLTALGNCWRAHCRKRHPAGPCSGVSGPAQGEETIDQSERRSSSNSNSSNNWDTEPTARANVEDKRYTSQPDIIASTSYRHRFNSRMYAESGIWAVDIDWKRSSSVGELAFDNQAAEFNEPRAVNDVEQLRSDRRPKRHSLAF